MRSPSTEKMLVVAWATLTSTASPLGPGTAFWNVATAARPSNVVDCARKSAKSGFENGQSRTLRARSSPQTIISRSASAYGSGRSKTAFTTLKMAVVAPIPRPSVSATVTENPGRLRSVLKPSFRSLRKVLHK